MARGTSAQRITFTANQTSPTAGAWQYINFADTSVDATFDSNGAYVGGSILQYCNVHYGAGGVYGAVRMLNTSPFIDNCAIDNSGSVSIYAINARNLRITNNTISNSGGGILLDGGTALILNNTITNNNNTAAGGVGGVNLYGTGEMHVSGNTITSNSASGNQIGMGGVWVAYNTGVVTITTA
jgi:parallel beta-helix repeat protein